MRATIEPVTVAAYPANSRSGQWLHAAGSDVRTWHGYDRCCAAGVLDGNSFVVSDGRGDPRPNCG